ncbi:CPBP family intramembrane glutamic endopeptidase [Desulfocucumis palustris]|nr:CPBP family intramembrane glutamic endopeptidase [Desulfocucumis palustris]
MEQNHGYLKHLKLFGAFYLVVLLSYLTLGRFTDNRHILELVTGQIALIGVLLLLFKVTPGGAAAALARMGLYKTLLFIAGGFVLGAINRYYLEYAAKQGFAVQPGDNQLKINSFDARGIDFVLLVAVITVTAPLLEELIFRFAALGRVHRLINASNLSIGRKGALSAALVFVVSILFALAHAPSPATLAVYFFSSVIYSLSYLKYGLPAAVLLHSAGNAFSLLIASL